MSVMTEQMILSVWFFIKSLKAWNSASKTKVWKIYWGYGMLLMLKSSSICQILQKSHFSSGSKSKKMYIERLGHYYI